MLFSLRRTATPRLTGLTLLLTGTSRLFSFSKILLCELLGLRIEKPLIHLTSELFAARLARAFDSVGCSCLAECSKPWPLLSLFFLCPVVLYSLSCPWMNFFRNEKASLLFDFGGVATLFSNSSMSEIWGGDFCTT